jgi:hypothetical protein
VPDLPVYRVSLSGGSLPAELEHELSGTGVILEGSEGGVGPSRHWVLVRASDAAKAIRLVRDAVSGRGTFAGFSAQPVRDSVGKVWTGRCYRRWQEIDWDARPERAALRELDRSVMGALADAAEPTRLVAREAGRPRPVVETALRELRDAGLVESETAPFSDGDYDNEREDWWRLTHRAWDLLGFIKPVLYH